MIDDFLRDPAGAIQMLLLMIPGVLVAVTIHEVAHGWVAERLGDPTARLAGRLTLDPRPHIDPLGALAFVIAGFGWARPVPVDARNLKHPVRDMACVAAAGPLSNFVAAFAGLVLLVLTVRLLDGDGFVARPVAGMLRYVYTFNLGLAIFNLIPLPPLDGGHFLPYFFPRRSWPVLARFQQYGPLLLLLLVFSGATRYIVGPLFGLVNALYLSALRALF
jgi:Zn-dependent protease